MAKNLIIYYSRKGENYVNGRIENRGTTISLIFQMNDFIIGVQG